MINTLRTAMVLMLLLSGVWLSSRSYADPFIRVPTTAIESTAVTENQLADLPAYATVQVLGGASPAASTLIAPGCD